MEDFNEVAMRDKSVSCGCIENTISMGYKSITTMGNESKVKAKIGSWIVLYERNKDYEIINCKSFRIDGVEYKEDTFYEMKKGKII